MYQQQHSRREFSLNKRRRREFPLLINSAFHPQNRCCVSSGWLSAPTCGVSENWKIYEEETTTTTRRRCWVLLNKDDDDDWKWKKHERDDDEASARVYLKQTSNFFLCPTLRVYKFLYGLYKFCHTLFNCEKHAERKPTSHLMKISVFIISLSLSDVCHTVFCFYIAAARCEGGREEKLYLKTRASFVGNSTRGESSSVRLWILYIQSFITW